MFIYFNYKTNIPLVFNFLLLFLFFPRHHARSAEFVALLAVSSTLFLFLHTQSLTSRLREMEVKLQPSEMSASGLSGNSIIQGTGQCIYIYDKTIYETIKALHLKKKKKKNDNWHNIKSIQFANISRLLNVFNVLFKMCLRCDAFARVSFNGALLNISDL